MLAQWSMTLQINGLLADFLYAPYTTDAARSGSIAFAGLWNIAMMFLGFFLSVCLFRKIDTMNLGRTADLSLKWGLSVFYFVMQVAAIVIR